MYITRHLVMQLSGKTIFLSFAQFDPPKQSQTHEDSARYSEKELLELLMELARDDEAPVRKRLR